MAPARDLATGRVAVDCGADAIYIGGPGFGARRAAGNSQDDVAALVEYARPFGVRVYATLNTLLMDDELDGARQVAQGLLDAGVDALIVQDMAWLRLGLPGVGMYHRPRPVCRPQAGAEKSREITLTADSATQNGVEFHASTQTSNIDPQEVAFLGRAGFRRVILERALSLDEIRAVRAACPEDVELEVFVHGAICVGYSGRCFMSRAADPARSGNRGDCSQPCRLAYDLVEGEGNVIVKGKHLLSVSDLDLSARLGELLDAGVSSFKIEGRLKDATYVRNVVSHYRRLLDEAMAARPGLRRASVGASTPDFVPDPAKSFIRSGGTEYFLDGPQRGVASSDTPKAMGEPVGRVEKTGCDRTGNHWFIMRSGGTAIARGDGICFFADGELQGTNVNRVEGGRIYPNRCEGIAPETEIFRNYDHAFVRTLQRSRMKRRIAATARLTATPSRVEITFTDETGLSVAVVREGNFDPTRDRAKMATVVREQLARSGDTIFDVQSVGIEGGEPEVFVPVSLLAQMRREGLESLLEARMKTAFERRPTAEDTAARFPRTRLEGAENVTNHLAERFWRDHGVTEIAPAIELHGAGAGGTVMRTRYCIRREIGECLKDGSRLCGDLRLERGVTRWGLDFDCEKCEMVVKKI